MNRIRELRQSRGWTQTQLGDRVGMAKTTISGYERGDHQVDPAMLCALCDLFGCTADYLLGRSTSPLPVITPEDADTLAAYHALPLELRRAVDGILAPYRAAAASEKKDA